MKFNLSKENSLFIVIKWKTEYIFDCLKNKLLLKLLHFIRPFITTQVLGSSVKLSWRRSDLRNSRSLHADIMNGR